MQNVLEKKDVYKNAANYFDGIKKIYDLETNDWREYIVGVLSANQKIFNENCSDEILNEIFFEATIDIWKNSIIPDIVSVQPMTAPCSEAFYRIGHKIESQELIAKTRKLKAKCYHESFQDLKCKNPIKELATVLAFEVKGEQEREVITDIRNNCETSICGSCFEESLEKLYFSFCKKLSDFYSEDIKANWILMKTPPDDYVGRLDIFKIPDKINGMTVYFDPLFPKNQAIIGYKGENELDSPYIYGPYISMASTPVIDPEFCYADRGILTRYSKRLVEGGSACYARMSWDE